MRNGLIGLVGAMALASTMATAGCSGGGGGGDTGGSPGSGGSVGAGGSASSGGVEGTGGNASSGGVEGTGGSAANGGAGGGGTSGSSVTSLSGTKALNELTTEEATQLCDDSYDFFETAIPKETNCKWKGVSYAASSSAPSEEVLKNNCINQEKACQEADPGSTTHLECGDLPKTCKVTVAEYSVCISDQVETFIQAVTEFPACATITRESTGPVFEFYAADPPASCNSIADKCPDLSIPKPTD